MSLSGSPIIELIVPTESDLHLVDRWLRADHVRRWWSDPEKNSRHYRQPELGTRHMLIMADGRKVGLILWQHPGRWELDEAGLTNIPTSVVDIDIMIGEPDMLGRGIGTTVIRTVAMQALADETVPYVIAATRTDNVASRRAFGKAGFRVDREFDDPGHGRAVLMILKRAGEGNSTPSAGQPAS